MGKRSRRRGEQTEPQDGAEPREEPAARRGCAPRPLPRRAPARGLAPGRGGRLPRAPLPLDRARRRAAERAGLAEDARTGRIPTSSSRSSARGTSFLAARRGPDSPLLARLREAERRARDMAPASAALERELRRVEDLRRQAETARAAARRPRPSATRSARRAMRLEAEVDARRVPRRGGRGAPGRAPPAGGAHRGESAAGEAVRRLAHRARGAARRARGRPRAPRGPPAPGRGAARGRRARPPGDRPPEHGPRPRRAAGRWRTRRGDDRRAARDRRSRPSSAPTRGFEHLTSPRSALRVGGRQPVPPPGRHPRRARAPRRLGALYADPVGLRHAR